MFQGELLSPLFFHMALAPLLPMPKRISYDYTTQSLMKINHNLNLKMCAKNNKEEIGLLQTVKTFSDDIKMEFRLDKCVKASFVRGKLTVKENIQIDIDTTIKKLEPEKSYKYLSINDGDGIQHSHVKKNIRKEYYQRIWLVMNSQLNAANMIDSKNTLAVLVVTYSFNIIDWAEQELQRIDRKTRKIMIAERMHHPKADKY